jgi:hypothetical protein
MMQPQGLRYCHTRRIAAASSPNLTICSVKSVHTLLRALLSALLCVRSGRRMSVLCMVCLTSMPPQFQHKNWSWNWSTSCAFSPVHLYSFAAAAGLDRLRPWGSHMHKLSPA